MFLDYYDDDTDGLAWRIRIYGTLDGKLHVEEWSGSPQSRRLSQFNTIVFGDTLFSEDQLKFHNMSKNKEMFDILDINEVDNCYYGLFRNNDVRAEEATYTVFKTADSEFGGVIHRLPYKVVVPSMFRTADDLYSLYVVVRDEDGKAVLQEISVPDEDLYGDERRIPIQQTMEQQQNADYKDDGI